MILLDIKRYIREHQAVRGDQLQARFRLSASALDGLINALVEQGHIYSTGSGCHNGACANCQGEQVIYQWRDQASRPFPIALSPQSR
jgi:hypothetical protein